ncbi:hypothetical protein [Burkholderia anthina]|uniref:hypothetical protein n=1 Tax=Burkholderia anthina TaxID=179879 RepID=UPI00158E10DE|nr:hypothetical protein [Burkholderia anthina]
MRARNKNLDYPASLKDILKRLWDGMRSGEFVSFRISITARDDGGAAKEVSIEGEQSGSGRWGFHFPKDSDSSPVESPEILRQKLAQIERSVRDYIVANALDGQWDVGEVEALIKAAVQSERSIDDFLCRTELPIRAFAQYGYDAHFAAPIMATACAMAGATALAGNDLSHASYCVDRGLFWASHNVLIPDPAGRFKARASTGGEGKALRYEPVKEMVAEFLETLAPDDGWESQAEAVHRVAVELNSKHSELVKKCGLISEDPFRTIQAWIQKDPARFPYRIRPDA